MTNGLRWGILGAGGIASAQVADMQLHGFTVAAVAARDLAKAQAWAAEMNVPTAYGSYEELAADPDLDAIYVATVHPAHAVHARLDARLERRHAQEVGFTARHRQ